MHFLFDACVSVHLLTQTLVYNQFVCLCFSTEKEEKAVDTEATQAPKEAEVEQGDAGFEDEDEEDGIVEVKNSRLLSKEETRVVLAALSKITYKMFARCDK